MITKFNEFLNESIRDQMVGVSDDVIRDKLKGMGIISQFEFIKNNGLPEEFYPISKEKLFKKYNKMNIKDKLQYIDSEFVPSIVYEDDEELIKYLDDSILTKIKTIRKIRKMENISDDEIKRQINDMSLTEDDLDESLIWVQDVIGQQYGDAAAAYFSGKDNDYWSHLSYIDRKIIINNYLDSEELEEDF